LGPVLLLLTGSFLLFPPRVLSFDILNALFDAHLLATERNVNGVFKDTLNLLRDLFMLLLKLEKLACDLLGSFMLRDGVLNQNSIIIARDLFVRSLTVVFVISCIDQGVAIVSRNELIHVPDCLVVLLLQLRLHRNQVLGEIYHGLIATH